LDLPLTIPSEQDQLTPLLSESEYAAAFAAYRTKTNQAELMLEWLRKHAEFIVKETDELSVLSVGTGYGEFDLAAIPILQKLAPRLRYTAIDPNAPMLEQFKTDFRARGIQNVELDVQNCSFEKFIASSPKQYDLIHFTHCLYFISDRAEAIKQSLKLLKPNGLILIFNSMTAGSQDLRIRFTKKATGKASLIFSAEQLKELLEHETIKHHFDVINSATDVTDCFSKRPTGGLLLNFFLLCNTDNIPRNLRSEVLDYMKLIAFREGSRFLILHPVGVFCISPQ
jgi:SAM-dependent methyltransferase